MKNGSTAAGMSLFSRAAAGQPGAPYQPPERPQESASPAVGIILGALDVDLRISDVYKRQILVHLVHQTGAGGAALAVLQSRKVGSGDLQLLGQMLQGYAPLRAQGSQARAERCHRTLSLIHI